MSELYLDQAATSKPKLEVVEAMMPYLTGDLWYNPSSLYSPAVKVKEDVENVRKIIADYINADADEIYFTSGGSESNCWAIQGFVNAWCDYRCRPVVLTTKIEHKSIISCAEGNEFSNVHFIGVDENGYVNLNLLESWLMHYANMDRPCSSYKTLVSIQFANNEIGAIQNIKEISDIVHYYGAILHTDAVQAFGQVPIDVKQLGIDMMSVSGHKIGTPKGIGFLYKKHDVEIMPLIFGSQEFGLRGGTENVPYIIGMGNAVELLKENEFEKLYLTSYRNYLIQSLENIGCKLIGSEENRLPNNVNIMLPEGVNGEGTMFMLDTADIMCSTGSACNSRMVEPSHVLKAIGLTDEEAMRCIRLTLPDNITTSNIDYAVEELKRCIELTGDDM